MANFKIKLTLILYLIFALIFSVYAHFNAESLLIFLFMVFINIMVFIALFFCVNGFTKSTKVIKILRGIWVLVIVLILFILFVIGSFYGFNSRDCYNLVAQNIFTGDIKVHCNFPPWYAKIIEGEQARVKLLEYCLKNKEKFNSSPFYIQNPDYCDKYKDPSIEFIYNKSNYQELGYQNILKQYRMKLLNNQEN